MQVLAMDEVAMVSDGDPGDAAAGSAVNGGVAGASYAISRGDGSGLRAGIRFGALDLVGVAAIGAGIGFIVYRMAR